MPAALSLYVNPVPPLAVAVMVPLLMQLMAGVVVAVTEIGADEVTVADVDCSQPAASFANTV